MKRLHDEIPDSSPPVDEHHKRHRKEDDTRRKSQRKRKHAEEPPSQPRRTTAWAAIGRDFAARKEEAEHKLHKRQCFRKFEYGHMESFKRMQNSGRQRLESYERAVRYYFEHSKMKLGEMQRKLVDVYMAAALKKFFNNDLVGELKFLAQKFLIEELNDAVAVLFPYVHPFAPSLSPLIHLGDVVVRLRDPPGLSPSWP